MSVPFKSYCMNVYGSQLWSYNDFRAVERFYMAWRKSIRRIWHIDIRSHNLLIHAINNCLPIGLLLDKYALNLFGVYLMVFMQYIKVQLIVNFTAKVQPYLKIIIILCINMMSICMIGGNLLISL